MLRIATRALNKLPFAPAVVFSFCNDNKLPDRFKNFERKKKDRPKTPASDTSNKNPEHQVSESEEAKKKEEPKQQEATQQIKKEEQPKTPPRRDDDYESFLKKNTSTLEELDKLQKEFMKKFSQNPNPNPDNSNNPNPNNSNSNDNNNNNNKKNNSGGPRKKETTWEWIKRLFEKDNQELRESVEKMKQEFDKSMPLKYRLLLGGSLLGYIFYRTVWGENVETYSYLVEAIKDGKVTAVTIQNIQTDKDTFQIKIKFKLSSGEIKQCRAPYLNEIKTLLMQRPHIAVEYQSKTDPVKVVGDLGNYASIVFMLIIMYSFYRSSRGKKGDEVKGMMNFQDPTKKKFEMVKQTNVRFKDVAGLQQSKYEVEEFVDFLKHPDRYKALGARIPKGALLTGPPGTGKTMLAKACAGQAGVPFFFVSGSEFVEMFVGVGASRVRQLFKQAKSMSPSIIFIDEIDAIGRKRHNTIASNDERDSTLNQLLVEMDGFGSDSRVIVLAATNRKELLDDALTRPGRFDRSVEITLPDLEGRREIFRVHLAPLKLSPERTLQQFASRLATLTPGFSGAEIANLCNEAAILAARNKKPYVEAQDFQASSDRLIGGVEKKTGMTREERRVVAVHQSGHAVVSWFLEGAHPLLKVTIVPRSKGALGFAQYLPSENRLEKQQELLDRICFILGGRCAEEHFFGRITTGAYDDLQKVHQLAEAMVTQFGMSKLGNQTFRSTEYLKNYSDKTAQLVDQEKNRIVKECTEKTMQLIKQHAHLITSLSEELLEKQTLDSRQIRRILGKRPFESHPSYAAYLEQAESGNKVEIIEEKLQNKDQKQTTTTDQNRQSV